MINRRESLAEKLMDLANIAVGAMVFGQFISGQPIQNSLMIFGALFWIILYSLSYFAIFPKRRKIEGE